MKATNKTMFAFSLVCLVLFLSKAAPAVIETLSYPEYTTPVPDNDPDEVVYPIYSDFPVLDEIVAKWSSEGEEGGLLFATTSAGTGSSGLDTYAFGTGSGDNPGQGADLAIMDVGLQDWNITDGVIADYLGPSGRDLHGGWMAVRALLRGFTGQIELGFVSDRQVDPGDGLESDEFGGTIFDISDTFNWYQGMDLNDYESYFDGQPYGNLPGVKVLGVWINVISNTGDATITGELRVDQINLVPEPATLAVLLIGGLVLLRGKRVG